MPELTIPSLMGIIVLVLAPPVVTIALFMYPRLKRPFMAIMVFTSILITKPFYQEIFFIAYRGPNRGFGVTLPDVFFIGFFYWIILCGMRKRIIWIPFNASVWLLLIAISLLSVINSLVPILSFFTIYAFIRALILYFVIVNIVRSRQDVNTIIKTFIAMIFWEAWIVFYDKYITHAIVYRSRGTFNHPNILAIFMELTIPVVLSACLTKVMHWRWNIIGIIAVLGGFIAALFTKSRAAAVITPFLMASIAFISFMLRPTWRKLVLIAVGILGASILFSAALPRLIRRFDRAPEQSRLTRTYFNDVCREMSRDFFLGIGINMYSYTLENSDYYWTVYPDYVDTADPEGFRESDFGKRRMGVAHHIYLLFAAETGIIGMMVYIFFILRLYIHNIVLYFRSKDTYYKAILLGLLLAFGAFHLHGFLEWFMRMTDVMFIFFILSGTMVAIGRIEKEEKRQKMIQINA